MTWTIRSLFSRKASRTGLNSLVWAALASLNASLSTVRLRIQTPNRASGNASRNGRRQPHAMKASLGIDWLRMRIIEPATTEGSAVAAMVMLSQNPRLLTGACSKTNDGAPTDSPPAEKPWIRRQRTSNTGAQAPIWP